MVELNKVYCIDNLELLKQLPDNYIDLIYCDILYGTGRNFVDYQDLKCDREVIEDHYLPRIKEMYRVLKDIGSIYLQMDTRINHWMRCLMDDVFGYDNFRNEIVWKYATSGSYKKYLVKNRDAILFYTKNKKNYYFQQQYIFDEFDYLKKLNTNNIIIENGEFFYNYNGEKRTFKKQLGEVWVDIPMVKRDGKEPIGYSTQKPKALLERIIKASSNENDIVADFYMGSGTSMVVAKELNRQFIGCDISQKAVDITNKRLKNVIKINKLF